MTELKADGLAWVVGLKGEEAKFNGICVKLIELLTDDVERFNDPVTGHPCVIVEPIPLVWIVVGNMHVAGNPEWKDWGIVPPKYLRPLDEDFSHELTHELEREA